MAEFITILVGLPLLKLIGEFYYRLGVWLCRSLEQAGRPVIAAPGDAGLVEIAAAQDDSRYSVALDTASAVICDLTARADMSPSEQLSIVTFGILEAMRQVEKQPHRQEQRHEPGHETGRWRRRE